MKKRKFYNNKNRNQKWTETPKGHEIDFADKYIGDSSYSDKYDYKRPAVQNLNNKKKKQRKIKTVKKALSVVLAILLICVGYTGMDIYMTRHEKPLLSMSHKKEASEVEISHMPISTTAIKVESVSLDASVMLSSIMSESTENGYTGVMFDAKRIDGTIGYASKLASIDTFGAVSNPASKPKDSIAKLYDNDILPIARICCYRDNVVPKFDSTAAIMNGEKPYQDEDGNTYLNPNSDSAYSYIKDIVSECNSYGINVFVLSECDLPENISGSYNDGFDYISKKLNEDFNNQIRILEEVDIKITGVDPESGDVTRSAIKKEIEDIEKPNSNQILYISTTADFKKVKNQIDKSDLTCYIIEE